MTVLFWSIFFPLKFVLVHGGTGVIFRYFDFLLSNLQFLQNVVIEHANFSFGPIRRPSNDGLTHQIHILLRIVQFSLGIFGHWSVFLSRFNTFVNSFYLAIISNCWVWFIGGIRRCLLHARILVLNEVALFVDLVGKEFDPTDSSEVIFCQQFFYQLLNFLWDWMGINRHWYLICVYVAYQHCYVFGLIGTHPEKHLVKHYS